MISKINEDDKDYKERKLELYYPDRLKKNKAAKLKEREEKNKKMCCKKSMIRFCC